MNTLTTKDVKHVAHGWAPTGLHFGDVRTSRRAEGFGEMGMVRASRRAEGFGDLWGGIGMADLGDEVTKEYVKDVAKQIVSEDTAVSGNRKNKVDGWQAGGANRDEEQEPISTFGLKGLGDALTDLTNMQIMGISVTTLALIGAGIYFLPKILKK